MIANLTEFRNARRWAAQTQIPAADRPCNDNHFMPRPVASAPHHIKKRLLSRWCVTPAGTLECAWEIAAEGASTNIQREGA